MIIFEIIKSIILCLTVLSNDEVKQKENSAILYHIKYYVKNQSDKYLVIATTRPETIFADTAVMIHPTDERYLEYKDQYVLIPIINKAIPIILDEAVDKEFGTGLVKVTPAHSKIDYLVGQKHNLPIVDIIDKHGRMVGTGTKFDGMKTKVCREEIVKDLIESKLLEKTVAYNNSIGCCYKCDTEIESIISDQWFVKMVPFVNKATEVVKNKQVKLIPEGQEHTYFNWLNNIHDWCISRQIAWGHQIPVWYCQDCKAVICEETTVNTCNVCNSNKLIQDENIEKYINIIKNAHKKIIFTNDHQSEIDVLI